MKRGPKPGGGVKQEELLEALAERAEAGGEWVDYDELAVALYGEATSATRNKVNYVIRALESQGKIITRPVRRAGARLAGPDDALPNT